MVKKSSIFTYLHVHLPVWHSLVVFFFCWLYFFSPQNERAEAFPAHGPPPSMMLYVHGFFVLCFSHCLRTEDTTGWQEKCWKINQRHPRQGEERIKHFSTTFVPPAFFACPLASWSSGWAIRSPPDYISWGLQNLLGASLSFTKRSRIDNGLLATLAFCCWCLHWLYFAMKKRRIK